MDKYERAALLLALLERSPRTWKQLADGGLSRAEVFAAIDRLTAAGEIIIVVGPILLRRLDVEGDDA